MDIRVEQLQQCIKERGFHPLTEYEEQELMKAVRRELADLDGLSVTTLITLPPTFGLEKMIQSLVDTFCMLRNVSKGW